MLIVCVGFVSANNNSNCHCNYTIGLSQNNVDASTLSIKPGDTICILSGNRKFLRLANFHGDSLNYIVFKNCGGSVIVENNDQSYGILITHSSYFRFTGTGYDSIKYGIKVIKTPAKTVGLSIDGMSTNFEIDHIEVANSGFAGIMSLTQPTCDRTENRGVFVQRNTSIHDNFVHNTGGEGFYIGHSFYSGYPTVCDGKADTLYPSELKGLRVFNNRIDSCGWDGIQVSCATSNCEIYNNYISHYGIAKEISQNSGIQIGSGTTGKCYNNAILNGSGTGIMIFGLGNNYFFNNIVVNSGYNFYSDDASKRVYGMFCADRATVPGSSFNFINNTIIAPKTDGIRIYSNQSRENKFFNNLILKPGSFGTYRDLSQSYIFYNSDVQVDILTNYYSQNLSPFLKFDSLASIYNFTSTLPIYNSGINVSTFGIFTDYFNNQRPVNNKIDIGAFQFDSLKRSNTERYNYKYYIYPNPSNGNFMVVYNGNEKMKKITLCTFSGLKIFEESDFLDNSKFIELKSRVKNGLYLLTIFTEKSQFASKIVIE